MLFLRPWSGGRERIRFQLGKKRKCFKNVLREKSTRQTKFAQALRLRDE